MKILILLLLTACASMKKNESIPGDGKQQDQVRVLSYEATRWVGYYNKFELDNDYRNFTLYLSQEQWKKAKASFEKLTNNPKQKVVITYTTPNEKAQACPQSIQIEEETVNLSDSACTQLLVADKSNYTPKPLIGSHSGNVPNRSDKEIDTFFSTNPEASSFKNIFDSRSVQIGMPKDLIFLMLGNPMRMETNDGETQLVFEDWYVYVVNNKVSGFSIR